MEDRESFSWLRDLRAGGAAAERAAAELHALLLNAARFEVARRAADLPLDTARTLAAEAAREALASIRAHLDDYRGTGRFTTWACKYAIFETAVKVRRHAWRDRDLTFGASDHTGTLRLLGHGDGDRGLARTLRAGMEEALTLHERRVLTALALDGVPIDVLAERLDTTRGALYATLHDARGALRRYAAARGHATAPLAEVRAG